MCIADHRVQFFSIFAICQGKSCNQNVYVRKWQKRLGTVVLACARLRAEKSDYWIILQTTHSSIHHSLLLWITQ